MIWMLNGCNLMRNSHAFNWSGCTSHDVPATDVGCGCGTFIMKAHSGRIEPSQYLKQQMRLANRLGNVQTQEDNDA